VGDLPVAPVVLQFSGHHACRDGERQEEMKHEARCKG